MGISHNTKFKIHAIISDYYALSRRFEGSSNSFATERLILPERGRMIIRPYRDTCCGERCRVRGVEQLSE